MVMIEAGSPVADAAVTAEGGVVLRELLARYASGDEGARVAVRELSTRYPSFRRPMHLPREPTAGASATARAREDRIDIGPILHEVAAISSDVDKHGMGSMRGLLRRTALGTSNPCVAERCWRRNRLPCRT